MNAVAHRNACGIATANRWRAFNAIDNGNFTWRQDRARRRNAPNGDDGSCGRSTQRQRQHAPPEYSPARPRLPVAEHGIAHSRFARMRHWRPQSGEAHDSTSMTANASRNA
jgi:hypothetical protein